MEQFFQYLFFYWLLFLWFSTLKSELHTSRIAFTWRFSENMNWMTLRMSLNLFVSFLYNKPRPKGVRPTVDCFFYMTQSSFLRQQLCKIYSKICMWPLGAIWGKHDLSQFCVILYSLQRFSGFSRAFQVAWIWVNKYDRWHLVYHNEWK